ncbi:MAG TPA: DUF1641 domain-containing protein [Burkholderiales bacterium]|nr:DUF1641 domain-containing protein [Burkholderiales bacterium]
MNAPTTERAALSEELERVVAAGRDSLTDEMVSRLAGTAADAMDLIDRVNRTGLAKAIPALAEMVNNGDLDRLAKLARVYGSGEDALTDEMVGRLAETIGEGMSLLDQVNRSGLEKAIPALARMANSGDLDRLSSLARVYASAEDALTDEMIARIAETLAEGMSLLDRLSRGGAGRLVEMLAQMETSGSLKRMAEAMPRLLQRMDMLEGMLAACDTAAAESARAPRAAGGVGGLWSMMRDPDNQDALRYLINLGKAMRGTSVRVKG